MINNDIDSRSASGMVRIVCRYFSVTSFTCVVTRVFIPVSDFSFPGIGNGKMSFPGMQGVTQWVVSALSFHCVDAVNALHAFVQPFRRTASRLQNGRAQFTLGRITGFFL